MEFTMKRILLVTAIALASSPVMSDELSDLKQQIEQLRQGYELRLQKLERRVEKAEAAATQAKINSTNMSKIIDRKIAQKISASPKYKSTPRTKENDFNPAISITLDGRHASFSNDAASYELPGFQLGGEAGIGDEGFSVRHTEITASANIDNNFYGQVTTAIAEHDGETEVELEEAFVQTTGLGNGVSVTAGRFFSNFGYLNEQHEHAWDFADAPLIYRGMVGKKIVDDGVRVSFVAPTDLFLEIGAEAFQGDAFPAGGEHSGVGAWTGFAHLGGDLGTDHSWQLGLSHWSADDITNRTGGGHSHGEDDSSETPTFAGDSHISAIDAVYKWAPNGNMKNQHLVLQMEYFDRNEDGTITMVGSDPLESSTYKGDQKGWYAQAVYQFMPRWRMGYRYDQLDANNSGDDMDVLEEAGLFDEHHTPKRHSAMIEWLPSEFSRVRLQYNKDESSADSDDQVFIQYTHSLGSHGAHQF